LDAEGALVWSESELGGRAFEPVVAGDSLVLGAEGVGVLALDLATGRERWRVAMDAESYSRPSMSVFGGSAPGPPAGSFGGSAPGPPAGSFGGSAPGPPVSVFGGIGELMHVAVRGDRPSVVRGYGEAWRWQLHAIDR